MPPRSNPQRIKQSGGGGVAGRMPVYGGAGKAQKQPPLPTFGERVKDWVTNTFPPPSTVPPVAERVANDSNIYNMPAQRHLATVPIYGKPNLGQANGVYSWTPNQKIDLRQDADERVVRHEFGHAFDDRNDITEAGSRFGWTQPQTFRGMYPRAGAPQLGALRENPFLGYSLAEQQLNDSEPDRFWRPFEQVQRMREFPGMFGNPSWEVEGYGPWGGREEMYARMNEIPARDVPQRMRPFFPQFSPSQWPVG